MNNLSRKIIKFSAFLFIISFFFSCQNKDTSPNVSNISMNVEIRRMEKELFSLKTKEEIQDYLLKNKNFVEEFYQTSPQDTSLINRIYLITHFPALDSLFRETEKTFGNADDLTAEFEDAFKHIKYYYPDFKAPKVITTFTAFDKDIFISDSLIVISLENFIGKKARFRPQQPNYILNRYEKQYIVPTIIKFLSNKYNKTNPNDMSLMADMIFYGKAFEFTKTMMPKTSDSLIMDYSTQQLNSTWHAQDLVYAHFVDKKLLYETNQRIKEKYLGERPITTEIGKECPGRIGQWLGWRIVTKFRKENSAISIQELMKITNSHEIFEKSKYRGQIEN